MAGFRYRAAITECHIKAERCLPQAYIDRDRTNATLNVIKRIDLWHSPF